MIVIIVFTSALNLTCYSTSRSRSRSGVSLVEMLVVVAILSILAGLGMFAMTGIFRSDVEGVTNRRNAQEVAALAMGATVAEAPLLVDGDTAATIRQMIEGREGTTGAFKGRMFRLTKMTDAEIEAAGEYLRWSDGMIHYIPTDK